MKRIALFVPVALITIACAPSDDPAEAGSSRVVREVFSEIWSKGNVELIPEYFSESFVGHCSRSSVHASS